MHDVIKDTLIYPIISLRKQGRSFAYQEASPRWPKLPGGPKACAAKDIPDKDQVHFVLSPLAIRSPTIYPNAVVYWCSARVPYSQLDDLYRSSSTVSSDR